MVVIQCSSRMQSLFSHIPQLGPPPQPSTQAVPLLRRVGIILNEPIQLFLEVRGGRRPAVHDPRLISTILDSSPRRRPSFLFGLEAETPRRSTMLDIIRLSRHMSQGLPRLMCLALLAAALMPRVDALYFYLKAGEKKCFLEELPNHTIVVGQYSLALKP